MRLVPLAVLSVLAASPPALADDGATVALVDRAVGPTLPLLPQGGVAGSSGLTLLKSTFMTGTGRYTYTQEGIVLGGDVGVTDRLELGAGYSAILRDDIGTYLDGGRWQGTISARASYLALDRGGDLIAATLDLADDVQPGSLSAALGVAMQHRLSSRLALYTPGGQLTMGRLAESGDHPVALHLPVGLAFQARPSLYVFAHTDVAQVGLADAADSYWLADAVPVVAGAFVSPARRLDLGLAISDDLESARSYTALALLRVFGV